MQEKFKLEDFFLKIFKVAILVMMTLAVVVMFALLLVAAYETSKRPNEPSPAQKAPQREVTLGDLKKELLKKSEPAPPPAQQQQQPKVPPSLRYLEEVTRVYRCSSEFAKKVNAEIDETDNAVTARRVEDLRNEIERLADGRGRGDHWVKSAVEFTCAALADPAIIAMRTEGKVKSVFFPILQYHLRRWDEIEEEKAAFERSEQERVERETQAEAMRILEAKSRAFTQFVAAAIAFGIFMALALYLILAKIESNLRNIDWAIRYSRHGRQSSPP